MSKKMDLNTLKVATKARVIAIVLTLLFLLTGCTAQTPASQTEQNSKTIESSSVAESEVESKVESKEESVDTTINAESLEALKDAASKEAEDAFNKLKSEYEQLLAEANTYENYKSNVDKVKNFYEKVVNDAEQLSIRLCEYGVEYAKAIVSSDKSYSEKYDDLEAIYDDLYDDIGEDIYDEIYDGILDDMYDDFYNGVLDKAYDDVEYREWADARSDEYDWWSDARSDAYRNWSDFRSDIYRFYSDIRSAVYKDKKDKIQSTIDDFVKDIEKMK